MDCGVAELSLGGPELAGAVDPRAVLPGVSLGSALVWVMVLGLTVLALTVLPFSLVVCATLRLKTLENVDCFWTHDVGLDVAELFGGTLLWLALLGTAMVGLP